MGELAPGRALGRGADGAAVAPTFLSATTWTGHEAHSHQ